MRVQFDSLSVATISVALLASVWISLSVDELALRQDFFADIGTAADGVPAPLTEYPEPVPAGDTGEPKMEKSVVWDGEIVGCVAGCQGVQVKRIPLNDDYPYFQAYLPDGATPEDYGVAELTTVRVRGVMTGIDCAYAKSVFHGACTPVVEIETIEPL